MLSRKKPLAPILLTLLSSLLTSWAWAVLVAGRVLPWQATREWALFFGVAIVVTSFRWWLYWSDISSPFRHTGRPLIAVAWGAGPAAVMAASFIGASYLLGGFYGFLWLPFYRMQILAGAVVVTAILECLLGASAGWIRDEDIRSALLAAVERRRGAMVWGSLVAIGVLQAAATSSPIGDDLGEYTGVALALLGGLPYPVHAAGTDYVSAGVIRTVLVTPALPVLLAASFAAFGRTLVGVAITFAVLKAAFPAVIYLAGREITGSRAVAYATAVLLSLFPVYQLHVLGAPEPDALFAILVLLLAFLAVKALSTMRWPYWAGMGVTAGLVAETRWEGLAFATAVLLVFCGLQRPKRLYWVLLLPFLLVLAPFAMTSLSLTGLLWPASVGAVSPRNVETNLRLLREIALPWYVQAVGVDAPVLVLLVMAMGLGVAASLILFWRTARPIVFIPLVGAGYIAASLLIHPQVLNPSSPVDVFRHWSTGIPYVALSLAYALNRGYGAAARRLPGRKSLALGLVGVALVAGAMYYDCERLARPEWQFGGHTRLLWTGTGYLLADVLRHPVPLPAWNDPRPGEELRAEQSKPLEQFSLRKTNASEPYDWTALIFALLGLAYASSPYPGKDVATINRTAVHAAIVSG